MADFPVPGCHANNLYFNCVSLGISIGGDLTLADVVISNNAIFIFRPVSASTGDILVDMCGVPLYRRKKVGSSDFQATCSSVNALIVLFNVGMERSPSPFASTQRVVIFL